MRCEQFTCNQNGTWQPPMSSDTNERAQLVLVFGAPQLLKGGDALREIRNRYPQAKIVGCSTAGEIIGTKVQDESLTVTAVEFEYTTLRTAAIELDASMDSYAAGKRLALSLWHADLKHVLVFSDGLHVNGSELTKGLTDQLPPHVAVTGGLAGDGARFAETFVIDGDRAATNKVVAIGFVSRRLEVGYGSMGGWDTFGPQRIVTRSKGSELFELDGCSALSLYNRYLGEYASGLPSTGLMFPLNIWLEDDAPPLVRTILGVNQQTESLVFAGDIPTGCKARLMRFSPGRLIDGAEGAASNCVQMVQNDQAQLAVLISCVGRKLVLKQRVEHEVEAVASMLPHAQLAGFYSYGEIAPSLAKKHAELHNQTMTITTFRES